MTVVLFALICLEPSVTFVLLPLTCLHPNFFSSQGHCIGTIRDWGPVHATENGDADRTTLTPEITLRAEEKHVDIPEWISCLLHKLIVILKRCRKSIPKIGLETCANKKTNE